MRTRMRDRANRGRMRKNPRRAVPESSCAFSANRGDAHGPLKSRDPKIGFFEPGMKVLAHGVVGVVVKALVSQKVFTAGSTSRLRPRRPPNTAMCSYAIWYADSESGRTSQLYCGLVLDRGTVRTSTTSRTSTFVSNSANAATGRAECPMVKNGLAIFQHCI